MAMTDHVAVKEDIEIEGIVLEKGNYQTKDLYFIDPGEGFYAYATAEYTAHADDKMISLIVNDYVLEQIPQKHKDRLHLKPNGIIHLTTLNTPIEYRVVLADGVIQKIYRTENEDDVASLPEEIRMNYNAEWK